MSFTGELGWELSVPTEFVADLHEHVVRAGADLGLRHAGAFAFDAARERRLVSVHAPDAVLWHGESLLRDGARAGHLTSASIAPTLGGSAGLAWIHGPVEGSWRVEIRGDPVPCRVSVDPFHDPRGERLRA